MPELLERASRYRYRAEELRTIAQDWIDADAMMMLARLAWQYEKMTILSGQPNRTGRATEKPVGMR